MYIYMIVNKINGNRYIGKRNKEPEKSTGYMGSGKIIKNAIRKYGKDNFSKVILEDDIKDKELLELLEVDYIYELKPEYNIAPGGGGGHKHTKQSKRKIAKSNSDRVITKETRKKISKVHKGKTLPLETRKKISDSVKHNGYKPTKEHLRSLRKSVAGFPTSINQKRAAAKANRERFWTEEMRAKSSASAKKRAARDRFNKAITNIPSIF